MKITKVFKYGQRLACFFILCLAVSPVFSQIQRTFKLASNCNCYFLTAIDFSSVQWSGGCSNGYCDGYGTVSFYDQNGAFAGTYVGDVTQGKINGYGTRFDETGAIVYRGNVVNNEFVDRAPFELASPFIGDFVIDSLLSGGINRSCYVSKAVFSQNGQLQEIRYTVSCNGQFISDNYYTCTLVITPNDSPYIRMANVNDNAQAFIVLNFLRYADRLFKWIKQQNTSQ